MQAYAHTVYPVDFNIHFFYLHAITLFQAAITLASTMQESPAPAFVILNNSYKSTHTNHLFSHFVTFLTY